MLVQFLLNNAEECQMYGLSIYIYIYIYIYNQDIKYNPIDKESQTTTIITNVPLYCECTSKL